MRASRLLSILILLQLRHRATAESLAAEFRVSVRTIYRDIDALGAAGIPVIADRGPGGGFELMAGYRTRLTGLGGDEAEALLLAGLPGPAAALGLGSAAARARGKLLASLPATSTESAGRIAARFHLDTADWYRSVEPVPHLPAVARAVLDEHPLTMVYESWSRTREWHVEPLGLVMKGGNWYLVARSGARMHSFKVSKMQRLEVDTQRFARPRRFDLATHWEAEIRRFEAALRPESATLMVSAAGLPRLAALGAFADAAVRTANPPDERGWSRVTLPIENIAQAALMLLGIGPELRVLKPATLRTRLRKLAKAVIARNGAARQPMQKALSLLPSRSRK